MLSRSRCPSGRRSPPAEYLPAEYTEDDDACAEAQRCGHCSFQPRRQRQCTVRRRRRRQCTVPDASPSASQASAHHSRRSRARSLPHQAGRRKSHPARQTRDGTLVPWQSHTLVFSRQGRAKGQGHPQGQAKPPSISSEGQKGQCSKTYLAAAAGQVRRRGYVAPRYHGVARWRITPAIASPHRRERCPTAVRIHPHGRPGALAPPHRCG